MANKELPKYYLAPAFIKQFACKGGSCNRTCCTSDWSLTIDKATFAKYHAIPDTDPVKLTVQRMIKRIPSSSEPSEGNYAYINRVPGSPLCAFLDKDGLCTLQRKFGEDMLSQTCKTYPRKPYIAENQLYMGLSTSCEAVAELALFDPEGLEFAYFETGDFGFKPIPLFVRQSGVYVDGFAKYFKELQFFAISLMQNRDYALWERLIIYGMFMKKLESSLCEDTLLIISQYNDYINSGEAHKALADIPRSPGFEVYLATLAAEKRLSFFCPDDLTALFAKVYSLLSFDPELTNEARVANYERAYDSHYKPWFDENSYILENLLVMELFNSAHNLLVFDRRGAFASFKRLALFYGVVRFVLVALSAQPDGMSHEEIIDTLALITSSFGPSHTNPNHPDILASDESIANKSMGFFASMLRE